MGVIHLYVKIGTYTCQEPFVVVDNLSADVLLGATFLQQKVENNWSRRLQVILTNSSTVTLADGNPHGANYITIPKSTRLCIRVIIAQRLEPHTEAITLVQFLNSGTFLEEAASKTYETSKASLPYGICNILKLKPFHVRMANISYT